MEPKKRGFASMSPEKQKEIARAGGKAVAAKGKDHMAKIGKNGGKKVALNREHMSEIGRKGGLAGRNKKPVVNEAKSGL